MKICFIASAFENIGVEYLSAALKEKGHETTLAFDPLLSDTYLFRSERLKKFFNYKEYLLQKILQEKPDLIAIASMSDSYPWAKEIATLIKQKTDIKIMIGGMHPSSVPDRVIYDDFVDYVCLGEGEEAICELADKLEKNEDTTNIPNIWAKINGQIFKNDPRPVNTDLDSLPLPDKEIFCKEFKGFCDYVYRINIGRGCLLKCSFCSNNIWHELYPKQKLKRKRSVKSVIAELKAAKEKYKFKHVLIIDDWFTDDIEWLTEFAKIYKKEIGLSFACDLYPGVNNEKVIKLLKEAGCSVVALGIQTIGEDIRKNILHRHESTKSIIDTLELLNKTKIFTYTDFIVGLPSQDMEEIKNIGRFLNRHRPDFSFFLWLRYYPNSPITRYAYSKGLLTDKDIEEINSGRHSGSFLGDGFTYDKDIAKAVAFLSTINLLPRRLVHLILDKEYYKFFPKSSFFTFRIMSVFVGWFKRCFHGKRGLFYFSQTENLLFNLHFAVKILLFKIKNQTKHNKK